jgi:hypothetical protein
MKPIKKKERRVGEENTRIDGLDDGKKLQSIKSMEGLDIFCGPIE